ncbi:hypothetical protein PoB_000681000 [Plakobranchus ocellatus]|uniref:Uncharacterized protein n=1 Tax=Plakobranchus ocellatus TaxID=259542 RepID=A0AAV3YCP5_9GAST|nr:hypothetical protein PoB_000681000 [Plakobranchus ocellatus]
MSRRKQSRPRHVDEGVTALEGADPFPGVRSDLAAAASTATLEDCQDKDLAVLALKKRANDNDDDNVDDNHVDNNSLNAEDDDTGISEAMAASHGMYSIHSDFFSHFSFLLVR